MKHFVFYFKVIGDHQRKEMVKMFTKLVFTCTQEVPTIRLLLRKDKNGGLWNLVILLGNSINPLTEKVTDKHALCTTLKTLMFKTLILHITCSSHKHSIPGGSWTVHILKGLCTKLLDTLHYVSASFYCGHLALCQCNLIP